ALIGLKRYNEAKSILDSILPMQLKKRDPEFLDKLYYQLGLIHMGLGNGQEAVKCFSKSLGLLKNQDSSKVIKALAEAYLLLGMKDKSMEVSAKLAATKKSGSFAGDRYR
ncbi:MAG: tetratricopeptide repeat protein, partial [Methanomassiliicoccales archaeon]|nr:tetratricopeptide repeat protein [Methanomassiliicoccales archaeon]